MFVNIVVITMKLRYKYNLINSFGLQAALLGKRKVNTEPLQTLQA